MLLQFSAWNWRDCSATPLWLAIQGPGWKPNPQLIQHLSRLAKAKNIAVVATKEGVEYPLFLPTHAERDQVFQGALDQLSIAVEWLQKLKSTELDSLLLWALELQISASVLPRMRLKSLLRLTSR